MFNPYRNQSVKTSSSYIFTVQMWRWFSHMKLSNNNSVSLLCMLALLNANGPEFTTLKLWPVKNNVVDISPPCYNFTFVVAPSHLAVLIAHNLHFSNLILSTQPLKGDVRLFPKLPSNEPSEAAGDETFTAMYLSWKWFHWIWLCKNKWKSEV